MKKSLVLLIVLSNLFFLQINSQLSLDEKIDEISKYIPKIARNSDSLEFYGKKLLNLSLKENNIKGKLNAYKAIGYSYTLKGQYKEGIKYYDSAILHEKYGLENEFKLIISIYRNKAINYSRMGVTDSSMKIFNYILPYVKHEKKFFDEARIYNDIGVIEMNLSNYEKSIELFNKSIDIFDKYESEQSKTSSLINIGIIYSKLGQYGKGCEVYNEVIRISIKYNNQRDLHRAYNNLSVIFRNQKKYDSALYYLKILVIHYNKNKQFAQESLAFQNIGNTFQEMKKYDSAFFYIEKALANYKNTNTENKKGEAFLILSKLFFETKNYNKSITYVDSSINIFVEIKDKNKLKQSYNFAAEIYEEKQDFKKANEYYKIIKQFEKENFKIENAKALHDIYAKYEVNKKDKEIQSLSSDKEFFKSSFLKIILFSLLIIMALVYYWRKYKTSNKELQVLREKLDNYKLDSKEEQKRHIILKCKATINLSDLLYVKSDGHYVEFYCKKQTKPEIDRDSLKNVLENISKDGFIRVHNSYIVNLNQIKIINSTKIMLENGTWIPLSRTYKNLLKETLHGDV